MVDQNCCQHRMLVRFGFVIVVALVFAIGRASHAGEAIDFWSFQKPVRSPIPSIASLDGRQVQNPIDAFIFHRLRQAGLSPAPRADAHTLVRRACFDLLGLPPTPEQVTRFVRNPSRAAWLDLIEQLLDSPHYGERWGRHWLDVARYADSGGYETDIYYRNAWRYRDYVVKSFNEDKPYDQFVQEQIAGDELWPNNLDLDPRRVYHVSDEQRRHLDALIATGFYTLGPRIHESGLDARRLHYETLTDWVDTTGSVFLGLTLGCARCHDHKFDPLSQTDYFALQAVYSGSREIEVPLLTAMEMADWKQHYPRLLAIDEARQAYRLFEEKVSGRPLTAPEAKEKQRLLNVIAQRVLDLPRRAAGAPNTPFDGLMEVPTASVLGHERPELVKVVYRLDRGELRRPLEPVHPALPLVLARATECDAALPAPTGGRKQLARWLTRPDHPLTARVMVNRIWQWHFGRGIVATPNDFGAMGQAPSHPLLLDWLATEFVARKWSIKEIHRLIMRSHVYQMSSRYSTERNLETDPENRMLWRMNRRRLEAEALWDAVHAVSGRLTLKLGGRPVVPPLADDEIAALRERWHWPVSADPRVHTRRGLYILVRRNFRFPMFEVFDAPVTSVSCPQREVTTVAPQALWSLNNRSVLRQAQCFANRVVQEVGDEPAACVERAWQVALGRPPTDREVTEALDLIRSLAIEFAAVNPETQHDLPLQTLATANSATENDALASLPRGHAMALVQFCLGLYNLNEFAFVD